MAWYRGRGIMRITCLHGYFIFREDQIGEIAKFNSMYEQDLVKKDDYFTFQLLASAPIYSVAASPWLSAAIPTATFCGQPWEVMAANGFIYNVSLKLIQAKELITTQAQFFRKYSNFMSRGLIQPGSFNTNWQQITGYSGGF